MYIFDNILKHLHILKKERKNKLKNYNNLIDNIRNC